MTEHPDRDLSAFLDEALSPGERAAVASHVDGCAACRARLADLRATSRLIAALPAPEPRRSLVPRIVRAPVWLRPVRLLSALGSGLFVFVFLASAVINSGSSLGGGTTAAERLAEKGQFGAAVNALASDADAQKRLEQQPTAAPAAPAPAPAAAQTGASNFDTARNSQAAVQTPSPVVGVVQSEGTGTGSAVYRGTFGPPPVVFLGLALLFAVAAILAHRRLRRA